ncbi:hypothetical protein HW090_08105 [Pseudomonas sp. ABC1]|uniref:TadE/TadG family type IV pilus assembly protein n=1 Tax=Pseudomonas sp. ABC1 TaxID=2748080 RepID=UPI0015C36C99|nr:TadE/TadG family type IV pilus assembly protein [Pseudomonas sp. ABC1]QLF93154.1 hypothetical protein HW090_08105 [Pseudomonas sp. ABC1]
MNASTRRQRGATAIEFVVLFGVFFGVLYSVIAYSVPLLLMLTFQHMAAEAARSAIAVAPGHEEKIEAHISSTFQRSWLKRWYGPCSQGTYGQFDADRRRLTVCVGYSVEDYRTAPIVPVLQLPLVGSIPRLPARIEGRSSIQL